MSVAYRELGAIVEFRGGGTPSKSRPEFYEHGTIPWVTPKDMKYWNIETSIDLITEDAVNNSAAKMVPVSSVLIVIRSGVLKHTLPVGVNSVPVTVNQDLKALVCSDLVDSMYLARFLKSSTRHILEKVKGTTADNVSTKDLKTLSVPLPPLAEQKRIAGILDAADTLRAKRREALAQLDTLLQSTFLDMFGDPVTNPMGWERSTLEDFSVRVTDGDHHTPKRTESGIKLLSARNVLDGDIDLTNTDFVDTAEYERMVKRCHPQKDDILISCSGSIGRVSRIRFDEPVVLVRSAALVKIDHARAVSEFVEHLLRTPALKAAMLRSSKSSSQANLFQKPIKMLPVFVPPIDHQRCFADIVESVEQQKTRMRSHLAELNTLFASLQSRAFNGEL